MHWMRREGASLRESSVIFEDDMTSQNRYFLETQGDEVELYLKPGFGLRQNIDYESL